MSSLWPMAALGVALCASEAQVVRDAADVIKQQYVLESRAGEIAVELRHWAEAAKLAPCRAPGDFAEDFTRKLRALSGDGHFYLESSARPQDDSWIAEWYAQGKSKGYGVGRVEILKHNIGLLRIDSFYDLESSFSRLHAAFTLLNDTAALVPDLRGNGGGPPETAWPLQWTFMDKGGPHGFPGRRYGPAR